MVEESPDITDVSTLPDLPELESVESGTEVSRLEYIVVSVFIALLTLFFSVLFVWMAFCLFELFGVSILLTISVVLFVLIVLLINFFLIRSLLTREYFLKTTSEGLIIGGLFHERFLAWDSVEDVEVILRRKLTMVFRTSKGETIPSGQALVSLFIYMSIWQHLRKRGKAEKLILPPDALSLWNPVTPD